MSRSIIRTIHNPDNGRAADVYFDDDGTYVVEYHALAGNFDEETFSPSEYDHLDALKAAARAESDAIWAAGDFTKAKVTNTEFIVHLMQTAQSGALMQAFIIDALTKHSEAVVEAPIEKFDPNGWVNPIAWKRCAAELQASITAHLA